MKYFSFALVILSLLCTGSVLAQTGPAKIDQFSTWPTYNSPKEGFSIKFPSAPLVEAVPIGSNDSNFSVNQTTVAGPRGRQFQVVVITFSKGLPSAIASMEGGLSSVINSYLEDGGKLLDRHNVTRGNCSGIEANVRITNAETNAPSLVKARTFSSGDRVYLVLHAGAAESSLEKSIADQFLDSFTLPGGCVESAAANVVRPSTTTSVSGQPDPVTGWQRFRPPYGISFLLPGAAQLVTENIAGPTGPITHFTYGYDDPAHVYSVEIFDGFDPEFRNTPGLIQAALDGVVAATRKNLEPAGLTLGHAKPVSLGAVTGREYLLSMRNAAAIGRLQVFVSKTRTYALIAFRKEAKADSGAMSRFFNSVEVP